MFSLSNPYLIYCAYLQGKIILLKLSLLFIVLSSTGCLTLTSKQPLPLQRGWFDIAEDHAFFRPCFGNESLQVLSYPHSLTRYHNSRSQKASSYIEWLGNIEPFSDEVTINNLRYLSSNPNSCAEVLEQNLMVVYGSNDRWNVLVRENSIRVFLDDNRQLIEFPHNQAVLFGNRWIWNSKVELPTGITHRMELTVEPDSFCRIDSDWFSFSATLIVDGKEFNGCARRGMLDVGMLNTHYQFPFYVSTRSFDLYLEPDGSVFLKEDYQGIQPVVESYGTWTLMPERRIMIQFAYNQDMLRQEVFVFALSHDGILVMEQGHSRYGPLGIELVPAGRTMTLDSSLLRKVPQ